jgi:hypothetical protein
MNTHATALRTSAVKAVVALLGLCACICSAQDQMHDTVLAVVGTTQISVGEFKARAELTVRPDRFMDKSVTLNNLILEKILAMEVGRHSSLNSNPGYQGYLKGIKEQTMRELLYRDSAYNKAIVDTSVLINAYTQSIREYEIEFYRMHKKMARQVRAAIDSLPGNTDRVFKELHAALGTHPVRTVNYKDPDPDAVHDALFTIPLQSGDVVGPIELGTGEYLVMRVVKWTAYPLLSGIDQQERWNDVAKKERSMLAAKLWGSYHAGIMKGKKIEFNRQTFLQLANLIREKYIAGQHQKTPMNDRIPEVSFKANGLDLSAPFFTFDNDVWTVGDFRNELMSRPLLFRNTTLDSANFNDEFKQACVDIVKDHCLTREAYNASLDKEPVVAKTVAMWSDAFVANDQQRSVVDAAVQDGKVSRDDELAISRYWDSYVNDMVKKYRPMVAVNLPVFRTLELTRVPMYALKPGLPYPSMVPGFPAFESRKDIDLIRNRN